MGCRTKSGTEQLTVPEGHRHQLIVTEELPLANDGTAMSAGLEDNRFRPDHDSHRPI